MANNIVKHEYNGFSIPQREEDGYVSLTKMGAAYPRKKVADFLKTKQTKAYLAALSTDMNICTSALVATKKGGNQKDLQGTWAHKEIAVKFAEWLSPDFEVWAKRSLVNLIEKSGQTPTEETQPVAIAPVDPLAYIEGAVALESLPNSMLKSLLHDALVDRLELDRNNSGNYLPAAKKRYTIVKVRAKELGYTDKQIGNGAALGAHVKRNVAADHQAAIGRYLVWHYEVNEELDQAINRFFS